MQDPFSGSHSLETRGREPITLRTAAGSSQMGPVGSPPGAVPRAITRSRQVEARSRLAFELRAIALDLLGLYEAEELPRECAAWLRTTIETAVSSISGPTVSALTSHLRSELAVAPVEVARRIDQAKRRHEAGFA